MTLLSFRRLRALLGKEFIQMRRDRLTFAMMLVVPLVQLLLFGFAINNDPKRLPAALVAVSQDPYTRAMISASSSPAITASIMSRAARQRRKT